jgi:long-chain fatty acid transport protein
MLRILILAAVVAIPRLAWAGGIEIDEQSARATGTAGAQTAVANDPAAVFYNPAGLVDQPGFGALVNGNLIYARTHVLADNTSTRVDHVALAPSVFLSQRLGRHVALGFGVFSQWDEHFGYPTNWAGRFLGQFIDITTATFDFSISVRLLPILSIGAGVDVVLGQLDLYQAANFGASEGNIHVGADAVGVGGNVGALIDLVPKRLRLGIMYRSKVDLDFSGHGAINGPVELRALTGGLLDASTSLPLPHTFAVGLAADPVHRLTLSADVRVTLWRDLQTLTLTLTDPGTAVGAMPQQQSVALDLHNSWTVRGGGELRLAGGRLHLRLGLGYDATPLPVQTLSPLLPDGNRVIASAGIGWHEHWFAVDIAYMAVVVLTRTATNPDLRATYDSNAHFFSASFTFRHARVAHQVPSPPPEETPPPREVP